jgi:hypothetical protein
LPPSKTNAIVDPAGGTQFAPQSSIPPKDDIGYANGKVDIGTSIL